MRGADPVCGGGCRGRWFWGDDGSVSRNLGMTDTSTARRASAPGWRDPRLWIGIAVVAASVLAGALVLGTSDDSVPVWAANDTMGPGHALTADDLTVRR